MRASSATTTPPVPREAQVWPQISARPLVFQMNLREPFTFNMAPAFSELMAESDAVRKERYADTEWRARALDELEHKILLKPNWALARGRREHGASRAGRPTGRRRRRGTGVHRRST